MRALFLAAVGLLLVPAVQAAAEEHETQFLMAEDFSSEFTIISGETTLDAPEVGRSVGLFRAETTRVGGLTRVCWQVPTPALVECANSPDGRLAIEVPAGSSFGFTFPTSYPIHVHADHGLGTFQDLSTTDGFDQRLNVGPSAIFSLVDETIEVGPVPSFTAGTTGAFTTLETGSTLAVVGADGTTLHTMEDEDEPMQVLGTPTFPDSLLAQVVVLPFEPGASARFIQASSGDAADGLAGDRLDLLQEILAQAKFLDPTTKSDPFQMIELAGPLVNEVFNGAFIRSTIDDEPRSLDDVAFAKFTELTVDHSGANLLDFTGTYTLLIGDFNEASGDSLSTGQGAPLTWWVWVLIIVAAAVVAAWFFVRTGPTEPPAAGPYRTAAFAAAAVAFLVLFVLWDWQLHSVLGTSLLRTSASGAALGLVAAVELGTLGLALLVIGVPVYLITRFGLVMARQSDFTVLAPSAAFLLTLGFGVFLLPAMVAFLVGVAG